MHWISKGGGKRENLNLDKYVFHAELANLLQFHIPANSDASLIIYGCLLVKCKAGNGESGI